MNHIIDKAIEVKSKEIDEIYASLQKNIALEAQLRAEILELNSKLVLVPGVYQNVANMFAYRQFMHTQLDLKKAQCQAAGEAQQDIKQKLIRANIDKQKFVKYKERHAFRQARALALREQKNLDELATQAFIRNRVRT